MHSSYLKVIASIIVLGAIFGGGYVAYRYSQTNDKAYSRLLATSENIPATVCVVNRGGFTDSNVGTLYVSGRSMRFDGAQRIKGYPSTTHTISRDGKIFYVWGQAQYDTQSGTHDFSYTMTEEGFLRDSSGQRFTLDNMQCSPWWFVDDSKFVLPDYIDFTKQIPPAW